MGQRLVEVLRADSGGDGTEDMLAFAGLGDARGFQVITDILSDRSDRPEGQGIPTASSDGRYRVARQIAADRYYAAHLLGDLRDPRAVPILVTLLKDTEVTSIVPWAPRAIARCVHSWRSVLSCDGIEFTWTARRTRRWFAPKWGISGTCRSRSPSSRR
jgi:hypothetical protein